MESKFKGTGVALVTPFNRDLTIDYDSLTRLINHVQKDVDYVVVSGTTGEAPTLEESEKIDLIKFIADHTDLPIMFGYGGNNTDKLIKGIDKYPWDNISGILSVCPYYNKPSQEGLIEHYSLLADALPSPVILYNVPGRTGINLSVSSTVHLSTHDNIIGVKEASGDLVQAFKIYTETDDDFLLISGDDLLTLPLISVGAVGVISVLANAFPRVFKDMLSFTGKRDWQKARESAQIILEINELMYKEGSPSGIKQLLAYMQLCNNNVRMPMAKVSDALAGDIFETYQKIKGTLTM